MATNFTEGGDRENLPTETLPIPYGLRSIPVIQFANERRRGWIEAEDSPIRDPGDAWDEHRNARMRKPQPEGARVLYVESVGIAGGEFGVDQSVDGLDVRYSLESNGDLELLDDLQWADWSREGYLLVATRSGQLQIRNLEGNGSNIRFEEDLLGLQPTPMPKLRDEILDVCSDMSQPYNDAVVNKLPF